MYGSATWFLTLMQEQVLRLYGNSVLSKIFGSNRQKITERLRKLHSQEARNLYSFLQTIKLIKYKRKANTKRLTWIFIIPTNFFSKNLKAKTIRGTQKYTLKNGYWVVNWKNLDHGVIQRREFMRPVAKRMFPWWAGNILIKYMTISFANINSWKELES
jgi:hypothetical protein